MKNILIVVFMLVVFNAFFVFSGGFAKLLEKERETEQISVDADIIDVFRFTLEDEVQKKIGVPVEGYEPVMFMQVFSGLTETDFDGVEASIGAYAIVDGRIVYQRDNTKLIHSAAKAITKKGIETLLYNVASRTEIDLQNGGTITDIMSVLTGV